MFLGKDVRTWPVLQGVKVSPLGVPFMLNAIGKRLWSWTPVNLLTSPHV
jgi:hypothetical protein